MRVALTALLLLLALPAGASAAPSFLAPDARTFTLGGGGRAAPRDGLPAIRADLGRGRLRGLAALPDGTVAVLTGDALALAVERDGRIRMLPRPPRGAGGLAAGPDGSLFTATMRQVLRLAPGAGAWTEALSLAALRGRRLVEVRSLAALPGGFVLALGGGTLLRVGTDGTATEVPVPEGYDPWNVAALPDGGFAYVAVDDFAQTDEILVVVPGAGPVRRFPERDDRTMDFAALPDGGFAWTRPPLEVLDAAGRVTGRAGLRPGLGPGDGGPPAQALLGNAGGIAPLADGGLVVEDLIAPRDAPLDAYAYRLPGTTLVTVPPEGASSAVLRVLAPPGTTRPLAAVAPSTFATLAAGRVGYVTTVAGHASVEVRRRGRVVARAEADVAAGAGELALPGAPPRGDLHVELSVQGAGGSVAGGYLGVSTAERLTMRRVRRVVGRDRAIGMRRGRCARVSGLRVRCQALGRAGRCFAVFDIRLRPDGALLRLRDPRFQGGHSRACRALGR
jgi:hypothetical protein